MHKTAALPNIPGRYIETSDGVPLGVYESGNPDGPNIIFLSGFGFDHCAFFTQFSSSLANRYRLIGVDLRGHGSSGKPNDPDLYSTSRPWAEDLEAVRTQCNAAGSVVVGWSFGAMVFMDWLRNYGTKDVRGFISVGSNAGMIKKSAEQKQRLANAIAGLGKKQPNFATEFEEAKAFVGNILHRPISSELEEMMTISNMRLPLYATQMMGKKIHENHDLNGSLTCPTLFILGEHDRANDQAEMEELAKSLPDARLEMMVDTGHAPFLEDPQAFNSLVAGFMTDQLAAE